MDHFSFMILSFPTNWACKEILVFALSIFFSFIPSSWSSREIFNSYLVIVEISLDSSITTNTLVNPNVKDLNILPTTYCPVILHWHVFTWFTNLVILVVNSLMDSVFSIYINYNFLLWVCNLTTFDLSTPA